MIGDLADTPRDRPELRSYLIRAITARIKQILGEPGLIQDDPLEVTHEMVRDPSKLLIAHIFGIEVGFNEGKPNQTVLHSWIGINLVAFRTWHPRGNEYEYRRVHRGDS